MDKIVIADPSGLYREVLDRTTQEDVESYLYMKLLTGILISLQISKSLAVCDCADIMITYSLPLMLPVPFNNNLFIFIGWVTC